MSSRVPTPVLSGTPDYMYRRVGPKPMPYVCPVCHQQVITKVKKKITMRAHALAAILCICGCILCMWIPYVLDSLKDITHKCPSCGALLGSYVAD